MLGFIYKKLNNRKGFSLIELVVVIAILGILAAVAIPRVTGSIATAKTNTDAANIRMIRGAIELAIAEGKIDIPTTDTDLVISWENTATTFAAATVTPDTKASDIKTALAKYMQAPPAESQANANGFTITIDKAGTVTVKTE